MTEAPPPATTETERKKRPASQYYWGDWWKDKGLHSCSLTARGLWHEINCLMHEGEPYGHLTLNGKGMSVAQLANQCRISASLCSKLLRELDEAGVPSRTAEGVIFSRRMVRDEATRNARGDGGKAGAEHGSKGATHGSKGGRPTTTKGGSETPLDGQKKPPPSSSSSSSSSSSPENPGRAAAAPPPPARAHEADPPEANGQPPTPAGTVCRAIRAAGLGETNPGDPRFLALLAQGATEAEFVGIATEAVAKARGWAWVLKVVQARRKEAADIALAPKPDDPMAWRKSVAGVQAKGAELGIYPGPDEKLEAFERRVLAAFRRSRAAPPPSTP
jgi:hypothetical protein